jgi:hypothetical protein
MFVRISASAAGQAFYFRKIRKGYVKLCLPVTKP